MAPASTLTVRAGERRFLCVSVLTEKSIGLSVIVMGKCGPVPLRLPTRLNCCDRGGSDGSKRGRRNR